MNGEACWDHPANGAICNLSDLWVGARTVMQDACATAINNDPRQLYLWLPATGSEETSWRELGLSPTGIAPTEIASNEIAPNGILSHCNLLPMNLFQWNLLPMNSIPMKSYQWQF